MFTYLLHSYLSGTAATQRLTYKSLCQICAPIISDCNIERVVKTGQQKPKILQK